ncbi:MAG: translation initiation factor IF-2 associated domain-containing protein, partial [Pseudomonadota bacterium]
MSEVTVKQFAEVVGIPVDHLLAQLSEAGLPIKNAQETISDNEKLQLLSYLRRSHGDSEIVAAAEPRKITLKRKTVSALKQTGAQGKIKTVSVEVRKKRTYVKRSVAIAEEQERIEGETAERERAEAAEQAIRESARLEREQEEKLKAEAE